MTLTILLIIAGFLALPVLIVGAVVLVLWAAWSVAENIDRGHG